MKTFEVYNKLGALLGHVRETNELNALVVAVKAYGESSVSYVKESHLK